jgi:hypothetical protein
MYVQSRQITATVRTRHYHQSTANNRDTLTIVGLLQVALQHFRSYFTDGASGRATVPPELLHTNLSAGLLQRNAHNNIVPCIPVFVCFCTILLDIFLT